MSTDLDRSPGNPFDYIYNGPTRGWEKTFSNPYTIGTGVQQSFYGNDGNLLNILDGSASAPDTTITPTVSISRFDKPAGNTTGGQNPALAVITRGAGTTNVAQSQAISAFVSEIGSADGVGYYADVRAQGTTSIAAFGAFFSTIAEAPTSSAIGLALGVTNNSGVDGTFAGYVPGNQGSFGVDVPAGGSNRSVAGMQIRGAGNTFDVGIGVGSAAIRTAVIQNFSNSTKIIVDAGTHTDGIDLSGATFTGSQIKFAMGANLVNAANDAGAAGAGVPVGGIYRNGSVLMVRVA